MSLRSIRSAIADWSPQSGRQPEPLAALIAVWPSIVGVAIAKNTRPAEFVRDTLVIVTRSSAWSQQLSFLSDDVLRGVRALPQGGSVERLRFRVGKIDVARAARPAASSAQRRPRADTVVEARMLAGAGDDVFARVRARVTLRRSSLSACAVCGALRDEPGVCAPCDAKPSSERMEAVQRLMYDAPWLGYAGMTRLVVGLGRDEYERWRRALLARWWQILVRGRYAKRITAVERRIASSYVLLHSGLEPDRVTPAVVRNLLGDEISALLDSASPPASAGPAGSPGAPSRRSVHADE